MRGDDRAGDLRRLLEEGYALGLYSGAAAGISTPAGRVVASIGTAARGEASPVVAGSLFDLASVSKTFTAVVVTRLAESGRVDLDEPAARTRAVGSGPGAEAITLRMLLAHVSGLPAESFLWRDGGIPEAERLERVLATELESIPDTRYRYSCLGYIAAGAVVERATATPLAALIQEFVTEPLGISVRFGPVDPALAVATEEEPWLGRGLVRGEVHDELTWFLGGRAGNAGLFGTAADVLTFAEIFLDDRLLGPTARRLATTNALEPRHDAPYGQALGPRLRDPELFGETDALGHGGFTGTMWLALPEKGIAAVLLTNRVHPHRDGVDIGPFRRRFSAWAAAA